MRGSTVGRAGTVGLAERLTVCQLTSFGSGADLLEAAVEIGCPVRIRQDYTLARFKPNGALVGLIGAEIPPLSLPLLLNWGSALSTLVVVSISPPFDISGYEFRPRPQLRCSLFYRAQTSLALDGAFMTQAIASDRVERVVGSVGTSYLWIWVGVSWWREVEVGAWDLERAPVGVAACCVDVQAVVAHL